MLGRGAEIESKTNSGKTALYYASMLDNFEVVKELLGRGAIVDLYTLSKYPELAIDRVHEQIKMEDKWASAFMLILKEQNEYNAENFKKYVLAFLDNTKTEVLENIRIILNTLI